MDSNNHNNNADNREEGTEMLQQHKQPPVVPQNAILTRGRKRKCQQPDDGHDEEEELLQLQKSADGSKGIEDGYADDIEFGTKSSSSNSANAASMMAIGVGVAPNHSKSVIGHEKCQKLLAQRDSLIQELSRQIFQLQEEKEENSKVFAENAKQIDALHIQLNEMRHPQILPPAKQMKIQLPFENWAELLGFLSRRELGEVVANVGNRHLAWLLQSFLHEYGEITLGSMEVLPPDEEFASGRPFIRAKPTYMETWRKNFFPVEHEAMPGNVVNFQEIQLSYLDNTVLIFLQQFKQKSLLANLNLSIATYMPVEIVQRVLTHLLPSIESINSIELWNMPSHFYDYAGNASPILLEMLPMARILRLSSKEGYKLVLDADRIEFCCRWLYTPREGDGKSRVLFLSAFSKITAISLFIDNQEAANEPVRFFIYLHCREIQEEFNFENVQTNERLEIKTLESKKKGWKYNTLLISRHPMALQRQWVEANEGGIGVDI